MATLNISTTENINEISNNDTLNENPTENPTDIRSEIPDSDQPTKKKGKEKIPLSVKNTLWSLHFQNSLNGVCQCCKTENISKNNFDCGHVKSEKEGGAVELSNLKPICRACNSSMGTLNMETFMKKYGFDKIPELKTESEKKVEIKVKEVDKEVEKAKEVKTKEKKDDKEEKLRREKEEKIKEDKIKEEERIKEEEKFMKETEKLEKQMKDANDKAIKLQKEYESVIEGAKKLQNEYMLIFNQLLVKCKNDDLKKMCQSLKMPKTVYGNKDEYVKGIYEFLNEKTINDYKEISKDLNIKCKNMISTVYYLSKNYV